MRQFLSLPVVLGSLLILTGAAGIVINWRSTRDLYKLNDTAMLPTVAFGELSGFLNLLEQDLVREANTRVGSEDQEKYRKSVRNLTKKITKRVNLQIDNSKGRPFETYLATWVADWEKYKKDLEAELDASKTRSKNRADLDARIPGLVERMTNVNQFIQADTKDMLADSTRFAKKAAIILVSTLLFGLIVGVFSSVVIVGGLRRLFMIIAEGKRNIETLLNNLEEGFLVFNGSGNVLDGVSNAAKLFFDQDPTDKPFHQILPVDPKAQESAMEWKDLLFTSGLAFEDFTTLAPTSFELKERYIEMDFRPIYQEKKAAEEDTAAVLEKVICIASDKTEERRLRFKAEADARRVKCIIAIVSDRQSFINYIKDTRRIIAELEQELPQPAPQLDFLFRNFHTLKGGFAQFHLIEMSEKAHHLENILAENRETWSANSSTFVSGLQTGVLGIKNDFEAFLDENQKITGHKDEEASQTRAISIKQINDYLGTIRKAVPSESRHIKILPYAV